MKILTANQLRALDELTVYEDNISSLELMERAAKAFSHTFARKFKPNHGPILVLCGSGNNGGDGFAVARLLHNKGYKIHVIACQIGRMSPDCHDNFQRARRLTFPLDILQEGDKLPTPAAGVVVIDALFGTGLNRPVTGYWARLIEHLNRREKLTRVAIDIPSGMLADGPSKGIVFKADYTFSLGHPKVGLFASENAPNIGELKVVSFPLSDPESVAHLRDLRAESGPDEVLEEKQIKQLIRKRQLHDHKGTFGHALLLAGSFGKMGAAVLAARATLRSGAGLVTCHVPRSGYEIMQISFPEAMCTVDAHRYHLTEVGDIEKYDSIGAGPGIGQSDLTAKAFCSVLARYGKPMVIDADALNIIAGEPAIFDIIPKGSILTPHPKEFERLFGETADSFARWQVQSLEARRRGLVIVLKGAYSSIATPDGHTFINPTGNPGMGTAGTGDVLTGLITGLLAQGYDSVTAAKLGVYLHGLAGDLAAEELSEPFLLAEDVVNHLGIAYKQLLDRTRR